VCACPGGGGGGPCVVPMDHFERRRRKKKGTAPSPLHMAMRTVMTKTSQGEMAPSLRD
jgi:hypothetical protein